MKKISKKIKKYMIALSSICLIQMAVPTSFAADWGYGGDPRSSTNVIASIIQSLMVVFRGAGVILLAYALFNFVLALKNEDSESKVNAASQIALAITCMSMATVLKAILGSVSDTDTSFLN